MYIRKQYPIHIKFNDRFIKQKRTLQTKTRYVKCRVEYTVFSITKDRLAWLYQSVEPNVFIFAFYMRWIEQSLITDVSFFNSLISNILLVYHVIICSKREFYLFCNILVKYRDVVLSTKDICTKNTFHFV